MDQSNLTIGGIGGDPSGSHPIGNLSSNWASSVDDMTIQYLANTIMSDPGATGAGETDTYYSKELCIGTIIPGTQFAIGDTGDAQIKACWQYYKPSNGNNFNSGNEVVPGTAASIDAGTWTDVGTLAQDYGTKTTIPATAADEEYLLAGVVRLRVKMVVTDAGSDGVGASEVTAGVAAVNGARVKIPVDKQAKNNDTINNPVTIGGIGADPS
tara:strand:- start:50 stop:685 length:636 start_codon:yes stop_codon:yes gene_type:complete